MPLSIIYGIQLYPNVGGFLFLACTTLKIKFTKCKLQEIYITVFLPFYNLFGAYSMEIMNIIRSGFNKK